MRGLLCSCLVMLTLLLTAHGIAMAQRVWEVPGDAAGIQAAVDSSSAGDEVLVTQTFTENNKVTVNKAVTITRDDGVTVTIAAGSSDTYALSITADGAVVEKLTLKAGSNPYGIVQMFDDSELRDCVLEDNGNIFTVGAADVFAGSKLQNCTFNMTSGQGRVVRICGSTSSERTEILNNTLNITLTSSGTLSEGIFADGSFPEVTYSIITGNTITFSGALASDGVGILLDEEANNTDVTNNTIVNGGDGIEVAATGATVVTDNVVHNVTRGIRMIQGSGFTVSNNTVVHDACTSGTDGIRIESLVSSNASDFHNNLIENTAYGINFVLTGTPPANWDFDHNAYWTDGGGCGAGTNKTLTSTQLATDKEPIFCGCRESTVQAWTHRIDSEVAKGNNGWEERIGAFGVECAWDTLLYNATLLGGESALVLEDVIVPSGKTLTLGAGSSLIFDPDDDSSQGLSGYQGLNELTVSGNLDVNGTSGNLVQFVSSAASDEGDSIGKPPPLAA